MRISQLILNTIGCIAFVAAIAGVFNAHYLNGRITELEQWWSAHHQVTSAIDSGNYNWRTYNDTGIGAWENAGTGGTLRPKWKDSYRKLSEQISNWLDTVTVLPSRMLLPIMKSGDMYYDTTDNRVKLIP